MLITRLGPSQFMVKDKPKQPQAVIALGWLDQKNKNHSRLAEADIVLAGLHESVSGIKPEKNFLVDCPGEYDIKDVFIKGIQDDGHIIYALDINGEKLVYLSGLAGDDLDARRLEQLGEVHVLIAALDGGKLDARSAAKLVNRIEPRLVIPMNYGEEDLKQFMKILGVEVRQQEDSLQVQADSLPEEGLSVKVLKVS